MNPFYFGTSGHRLFGVYDPPREPDRRTGVVLCYPWGPEYLRAHRPFRFLAVLLASAGHHVLRFDYHGTGDSGGDQNGGGPPSWRVDIGAAIDELKDMADPREVTVCGLRMGAVWALQVAAERKDIHRVVAWDPILDGRAYTQTLEQRARRDGNADMLDVQGFLLTPEV